MATGAGKHRAMKRTKGAAGGRAPAYLRQKRWWERPATELLARGGALVLLLGAVGAGLYQGGHLDRLLEPASGSALSAMRLSARDVRIAGLKLQKPEAVLELLGIAPGRPLVGFDTTRARKVLQDADWVKKAEVLRRFPDGIEIRIVERRPVARWQVSGATWLVDEEGALISSLDVKRFAHLPLVKGEEANMAALLLVNRLQAHPGIRAALRFAERVNGRRWNLHLKGGLVVLLPEHDVMPALGRLEDMIRRHGLTARALARLDMRNPGRLLLAVAPLAERQ